MSPNNALADHFLKMAGIGGVFADADGAIEFTDALMISPPINRVVFCCAGGKQQQVADRARSLVPLHNDDHAAAISAIREAAAELLIGLTPHETVVKRAHAAIARVEQTMADMQKSGALKAMNREFRAAREAGLASSYSAFVHAKKIALLEAIATRR